MTKLFIGDQVTYNGRECEVIGEWYPHRFGNPSSKARHYLLRPIQKTWQGSQYAVQPAHVISYDPSFFQPQLSRLVTTVRVFSCSVVSKNLKVLATNYDPAQQPYEDGDI